MKIIITESHIRRIIKEIGVTKHTKTRLGQRLIDQGFYEVVAFSKNNLDKIIIGKYEIPQDAIITADNVLNKLGDPLYVIPPNVGLIIKLYEFKLNLQNVIFIGSPQEQIKYKYIFNDKYNWDIYLRTIPKKDEKVTYGRILVCGSVGNVIRTTYLLTGTNRTINKTKEIMLQKFKNLNEVVYIDNPETQLDAYIDVDRARTKLSQEPQTLEPSSILTDREKRLQAYNERNKRKLRKK